MTSPWVGWAVGVGVLAGVVAGLALQMRPAPPPALVVTQGKCSAAPRWVVGWSEQTDAVQVRQDQALYFGGQGYISADVCSPGMLRMQAVPVQAGGAGVRLEAGLLTPTGQSIPLADKTLMGGPEGLTIDVPQAGRVILLYRYPYYKAEVRGVALYLLRQAGCSGLHVNVPEPAQARWQPEAKLLTLTGERPVQVTPCGPGSLQFDLTGEPALGEYPLLRFEQGGHTVREIRASSTRVRTSLPVEAGPVILTIVNPAARVEGHRQLTLTNVSFAPTLVQ